FRRGMFPARAARLLGTGFQGETKKAEIELSPLRFNPASGQMLLHRRLLVRIDFTEADPGEISLGGTRGRRPVTRLRPTSGVIADLVVRAPGLYEIPLGDLFGAARPVAVSSLSLAHRGQEVAFHVDRASSVPGSSLYFVSPGAAVNPDGAEAVYEVRRKTSGLRV